MVDVCGAAEQGGRGRGGQEPPRGVEGAVEELEVAARQAGVGVQLSPTPSPLPSYIPSASTFLPSDTAQLAILARHSFGPVTRSAPFTPSTLFISPSNTSPGEMRSAAELTTITPRPSLPLTLAPCTPTHTASVVSLHPHHTSFSPFKFFTPSTPSTPRTPFTPPEVRCAPPAAQLATLASQPLAPCPCHTLSASLCPPHQVRCETLPG